ncbi:MAG TPA: histidine triad nucleotide-binding protein [Micromonosporaceae bacterium]
MTADCLFCRIAAGELPAEVVHQTGTTMAFRDIDPKAPSHVLVIPKRHLANLAELADADPSLVRDVLATAAAVAKAEGLAEDGWRLLFNTGRHAGQVVFHVHGHVLGGRPLGPMLAGERT